MRILYHHRIRSKDGQFVHMEELIGALERRGHIVELVGPEAIREDELGGESNLLDRLRSSLPKALYELAELAYGFFAFIRLRRAVRAFRPDVIYERYNLHAPAGVLTAKLTGIPLLLEVNSPLAEERGKHGGLGLPGLAGLIEGWIWRGADRVIAVTDVLARRIEDRHVPRSRIDVMPNGIDLARFDAAPPRDEAKRGLGLEGRTILGFIGFARPWHGLDRVVSWLADSGREDLTLVVAGDGPVLPDLKRQASASGIADRVVFMGVVARDEVPACVAAFDIALQPAVVDYASPLKLFEYMALSKAIVAPASPNIEEILTHEIDALLGTPEDLTARLERMADDPDLRRRLGEAARTTLEHKDLTWDRNASRVERIARELVRSRALSVQAESPERSESAAE